MSTHITRGDQTLCGRKLADIPKEFGISDPVTAPRTSYPQTMYFDPQTGDYVVRSLRDTLRWEGREQIRRLVTCNACIDAWEREQ